jgi:hypothetical protein
MSTGLNVKSTKTLTNKTIERIDGRNAEKYNSEKDVGFYFLARKQPIFRGNINRFVKR